MSSKKTGILYIVSTPIGNLNDISMRSLSVLDSVDLIAAEDTRNAKKLLSFYGISKPLISLHEYNEKSKAQKIIHCLLKGINVALISDAGTPLISDPGYHIVLIARLNMITITPIPGACALVAALCVSALSSGQFTFHGFLSNKQNIRKKYLKSIAQSNFTNIFYESKHRIVESLLDICRILGNSRRICIAREITKSFETVKTGKASEVVKWLNSNLDQRKGEFVILIEGKNINYRKKIEKYIHQTLLVLMVNLPLRKVIKIVSDLLNRNLKTSAISENSRQNL